jgi:hypothetical protein
VAATENALDIGAEIWYTGFTKKKVVSQSKTAQPHVDFLAQVELPERSNLHQV